jgi:hypothetical protein
MPSGAEAFVYDVPSGTAEAVPFQNTFMRLVLVRWKDLLRGDGLRVELGLVTARSVLVQDALLDALVHGRSGSVERLPGGVFVALGNGLA